MSLPPNDAPALLSAWGAGDLDAGKEFMALVYNELRRLAAHYLESERTDHTLQATALVHELYLKLFSVKPVELQDRAHFFSIAARQLRHLVVDYARTGRARKRGGSQGRISLDDVCEVTAAAADSRLLDLDRALEDLAKLDARAAQVVELRYFGGLTESETGKALAISVATVKRDWDFARAWLLKEMDS